MRSWTVMLAFVLAFVTLRTVDAQQLVGEWAVDDMNMAVGQTFSFRPDGSYEYQVWQIQPETRRVVQAEDGSYAVQGDRLTLYPRKGGASTFAWQLTRDPYVGSPMLHLYDAGGKDWQFYAQSSGPAPSPPGNCGARCGEAFTDCNIEGKPYSYCSDQVERCMASCR